MNSMTHGQLSITFFFFFAVNSTIQRGFPNDSGGRVCLQEIILKGDLGLIPGSGRSPGKGNGNPLQYSCLGSPMDREAWPLYGP